MQVILSGMTEYPPELKQLLLFEPESSGRRLSSALRATKQKEIDQAEIPDPDVYPRLYKLVTSVMMHRPCGQLTNPACRKDSKKDSEQCTKHFPKPACSESSLDENGYASLRRRMRFSTTLRQDGKEIRVSDEYCVSYNSHLLLKYEGHINLEICSSVKCFKYLYKYIFKGTLYIQVAM